MLTVYNINADKYNEFFSKTGDVQLICTYLRIYTISNETE
jgi:hypothetical protein